MEDRWLYVCIGVVFVALLGVSFWLASADEARWQKYAKEHNCHAVGKKAGQVVTSFDSKGRMVTGIGSDQTIYACEGGEMQIR